MQVMPAGISIIALLLSMGGGGNDLLDYMPSKDYWQAKGVTISVENMVPELKTKKGTAAAPASSVRRLMAIRTLGELKKQKAESALKSLLNSKRPFVADYAARALASISGKPYKQSGPSKLELQKQLGLMPQNCGIAGQAAGPGILGGKTSTISLEEVFDTVEDMLGPMGGQVDQNQLRSQYVTTMVGIVEQTGNIRLNSITLGVADNVGNDTGFVVLTASGIYNSKAIKNLLTPMAEKTETVEGIPVLYPEDDEMALLLPSDTTFVMLVGPGREELPLKEVTAALASQRKGLSESSGLKKLAASIETADSPMWAVVKITDEYRHELERELEFIRPLDWITLTTAQEKENCLSFKLNAHGEDAGSVSEGAMQFHSMLQEGIAGLKEAIEERQQFKGFISPYLSLLESIKLKQEGKEVTVQGVWEGAPIGSFGGAFIAPLALFSTARFQRAAPSSAPPYQPGKSSKKAAPAPSNP